MLKWLYDNDPKTYHRNLFNIVTIGRWDDLFYRKDIISWEVLDFIKSHFNDTLLRKSLPRESVNSNMARHMAQLFGMTMKEYRLHSRTSWDFINTLYRPIPEYNVNLG